MYQRGLAIVLVLEKRVKAPDSWVTYAGEPLDHLAWWDILYLDNDDDDYYRSGRVDSWEQEMFTDEYATRLT